MSINKSWCLSKDVSVGSSLAPLYTKWSGFEAGFHPAQLALTPHLLLLISMYILCTPWQHFFWTDTVATWSAHSYINLEFLIGKYERIERFLGRAKHFYLCLWHWDLEHLNFACWKLERVYADATLLSCCRWHDLTMYATWPISRMALVCLHIRLYGYGSNLIVFIASSRGYI
jgi:hypothetical protein